MLDDESYTISGSGPGPRSQWGRRSAHDGQKRDPRVSTRSMFPAKLMRQPRSGQ